MQVNFVRYKTHVMRIISYPFLGVHPHVVTLISLFFSLLFAFFLVQHQYSFAFFCLFGSIFDAIDGYVARHTGKASAFGGVLDSFCDRIADFLMLAAFGYGGIVSFSIVMPVLLTTFLVSYLRARTEAALQGKKMASGIFQRTGRFVVVFIGFLWYFLTGEIEVFTKILLVMLVLNSITIAERLYKAQKLLL